MIIIGNRHFFLEPACSRYEYALKGRPEPELAHHHHPDGGVDHEQHSASTVG
ncbi:MAG: hypothetical protein U0176_08420 [Bacteroidia bacterium]